ncbi:Hypothetical_protein [Hexamita inflata]|uniref:Hypothetical_protein n=1 Tax=Hexamita inflata TaxID=28002 RepID=A0AA86TAF0_9EUKA|nr:Hypothetical protein HINF_LOCUS495 [Hexamita inflata]
MQSVKFIVERMQSPQICVILQQQTGRPVNVEDGDKTSRLILYFENDFQSAFNIYKYYKQHLSVNEFPVLDVVLAVVPKEEMRRRIVKFVETAKHDELSKLKVKMNEAYKQDKEWFQTKMYHNEHIRVLSQSLTNKLK